MNQASRCCLGLVAICAPCATIATSLAAAQAPSVSGVVRDPSRAIVAGAQINLDGADVHTSTTSDNSGIYTFPSPGSGSYTITAQKQGFAPITMSVVVAPGGSLTEDLSFTILSAQSTVSVQASAAGTSAAGYYAGTVDRGVLGNAPIVNQPYTITVLPNEQITNTQVKNLRDALKYLPLVQFTEQQGPEIIRPATRGFQGAIAQNTRMDGMAIAITGANAIEQYQEVQVESGLGAAMYGPANPSGIFDFVLKRPTDARTTNFYLEQDSTSVGTAWLDSGGRLGRNKTFGYRTTCSTVTARSSFRTAASAAASPCSPSTSAWHPAPRSTRTTASTTSSNAATPDGSPTGKTRQPAATARTPRPTSSCRQHPIPPCAATARLTRVSTSPHKAPVHAFCTTFRPTGMRWPAAWRSVLTASSTHPSTSSPATPATTPRR